MSKRDDAKEILKSLGLPKQQQNERSCLTLLALAGLSEDDPWSAKHVAAWTTRAPRQQPSGQRPPYPAHPASRVAKALRWAARALRPSTSVLGNLRRRRRGRLGIGTALRATACPLAKRFERRIPTGEADRRESSAVDEANQRERPRKARRCRALERGLPVIPVVGTEPAHATNAVGQAGAMNANPNGAKHRRSECAPDTESPRGDDAAP